MSKTESETGDGGTGDLAALAEVALNPTVDGLVVESFLDRITAATEQDGERARLIKEAEKAISPDPRAFDLFRLLLADALK